MKPLFKAPLTLRGERHLVKVMKISDGQIKRMVHLIFKGLKEGKLVQFKEQEEKVFLRAISIIKKDLNRELELDQEVHVMMDQLERDNPGSFQRYKMFPILKKKLAEKKGIIL